MYTQSMPQKDQHIDGDEDEWEYEYHETETESFYLNLDLSTIHGPIRPPRRRQQQDDTTISTPNPEDENLASREASATPLELSTARDAFTPLASAESDALASERIQILGLHTCNPIVSYCNQLFSCTWADQIGTELIFAHPDARADPETSNTEGQSLPAPLLQGPSFELLAANSVKILGRKANITSSSTPGLVVDSQQTGTGTSTDVPASISAGEGQTTSTGVPRRAVQPSHQSDFLTRLQAIKAARGETDTVRTTFSTIRRNATVADRLAAWARTEAQLAEIQELNTRAHKGDAEAIAALEKMMRDLVQQQQQLHREQQEQEYQGQREEREEQRERGQEQEHGEQQEAGASLPIDPQLI